MPGRPPLPPAGWEVESLGVGGELHLLAGLPLWDALASLLLLPHTAAVLQPGPLPPVAQDLPHLVDTSSTADIQVRRGEGGRGQPVAIGH